MDFGYCSFYALLQNRRSDQNDRSNFQLTDIQDNDFSLLDSGMGMPMQRTAYSDRTSWLMAILADMAYEPFEKQSDFTLEGIAEELAQVSGDVKSIKDKLSAARNALKAGDLDVEAAMKTVLDVGGFELIDTFFSRSFTPSSISPADFKDIDKLKSFIQDTQGFVAARKAGGDQPPIAVLVFRGTTNIKDWITNANAVLKQPPEGGNRIHPGFKAAYDNVKGQILASLEKVEGLTCISRGILSAVPWPFAQPMICRRRDSPPATPSVGHGWVIRLSSIVSRHQFIGSSMASIRCR